MPSTGLVLVRTIVCSERRGIVGEATARRLSGAGPHLPVRKQVADDEVRVRARLAQEPDLVGAARLEASHARRFCAREGHVGVRRGERAATARVAVVGPGAIQHRANRHVTRQLRKRTEVVVVQVRQHGIVDAGRPVVRHDAACVPRNPLARPPCPVGHHGHSTRRAHRRAAITRIELHRRAVGQDEQRRVTASGVDHMDVERACLPGRQRAAHGLGRERRACSLEHEVRR